MNFITTLIFLLSLSSYAQLNRDSIPSHLDINSFPTLDQTRLYKSDKFKSENNLPNIVLIGYWPPTNEMLREFSANPSQNPKGWLGENWRGLGYNIYSYFPEFPDGVGIGAGDFQVDYQSTSDDFWRIIPSHSPVAVLSFGLSGSDNKWEIEMFNRNLFRWNKDYKFPYRPTLSPPDKDYGTNKGRYSVFPSEEVLSVLQNDFKHIRSYQDSSGAGSFLCEYLGYHISWYQALNPNVMKFGTHTHIGGKNKVADLKKALRANLEVLINSLINKI